MIDFKESFLPEKRLTTLTAFVSEVELMARGKHFAKEVIHELVKQSVLVHRIDLENMITEYINSEDAKKYIHDYIKDAIANAIREEVREMFLK